MVQLFFTAIFVLVAFAGTIPSLAAAAVRSRRNGDAWELFDSAMAVGRAHSAVISVNGFLFVAGGCVDSACNEQVNVVDIIDPNGQTAPTHMEIPIEVGMVKNSRKRQSNLSVPLGFAGPTTIVRVDNAENIVGNDGDAHALYVLGPCMNYFPHHQKFPNSAPAWEKYSSIWHLSTDLRRVVNVFNINPNPEGSGGEMDESPRRSLRVNATCVVAKHLIFILGGVDLGTGKALNTIDTYNVESRSYTHEVAVLTTAVRNPLVAVDSELIYVAGGEEQAPSEGLCVNSETTLHSTNNERGEVQANCSKRRMTSSWRPSSTVQMIRFNSGSSERYSVFLLPENLQLFSIGGRDNNDTTFSGGYLFTFNGRLCLAVNTTFGNCLDMESLLSHGQANNTYMDGTWKPFWKTKNSTQVAMPTLFAFPLSVGVLGSELTLFEFGGFDRNGEASKKIFYGVTALSVTSVPRLEMSVLSNASLNLTLFPSKNGLVRLSESPVCIGNAAGTHDVSVFKSTEKTTVAAFYPTNDSSHVYVCFANMRVPLPCNRSDCREPRKETCLYTPITFVPFRITQTISPGSDERRNSYTTLCVRFGVMPVAMLGFVAAAFVQLRFRLFAGEGGERAVRFLDGLDGDGGGEAEDPASVSVAVHGDENAMDVSVSSDAALPGRVGPTKTTCLSSNSERYSTVKNVLQDSCYRFLREIGKGAFSYVYLVERKTDGQLFALKLNDCRKDRNRQIALQGCETTKSAQSHPCIIRFVDGPIKNDFCCGLVVEYHPQGDLCSYTLQHSAEHNLDLRRQIENEERERKAREEDPKRMEDVKEDPVSLKVGCRELFLSLSFSSQSPPVVSSPERVHSCSHNAAAGSTSHSDDIDSTLSAGRRESRANHMPRGGATDVMRANAFTEPQLVSIAYQLFLGLNHLHSRSNPIVHRDLKPQNILIRGEAPGRASDNSRDNTQRGGGDAAAGVHGGAGPDKLVGDFIPIVLADFGLAGFQEDQRSMASCCGTRPYIAPECYSQRTTTASDVWSFGCVLYALATARVTPKTTRIMHEEAKCKGFLAMVRHDIQSKGYSMQFSKFVASLLEVDPEKRPSARTALQYFVVEDGVVWLEPTRPFPKPHLGRAN